ncbi:Uncharacterised protein [uncultured archaeon]|nr:Uncharacterised protein [uncultured archaeon]
MDMNDTTGNKGKAYEWIRGKDETDKARISYVLSEQCQQPPPEGGGMTN